MRPTLLSLPAALLLSSVRPPVRVQLHEGTNLAVALSPDHRTLAIDLLGSIWTLPVSGGTAKRITDELMDARQPTWSSDGRRIAFQAYRSSTWHIWSVDTDGTDLKQLTTGPSDDREPHWSPDGARIAFSSDRSGNYDIWILTLATGRLDRVTTNPANDFGPSWSPDSKEIAFASDRRDAPGVYAITAAAPRTERLVERAAGAVSAPSWSPDGRTVAFTLLTPPKSSLMAGGKNIADVDEDVFPFRPQWLSGSDLVYTADGKIKRRPVVGGPAATIEFTADVSFTRPAFTPRRRNFARSGPQPVRGIMHPAISPDGKQIAFAALGDLWIMPVGGKPQRVTHDAFVEMDPAWSPDSKRLVYSSDRAGSMDLWLRDVASGKEERLTSFPGAATLGAWSPDGKRIAFLHDSDSLDVIDVSAESGSHHITSRAVPHEPGGPSWSRDGRYVVLSALVPSSTRFREGTNQVLRVDVSGGPDRWFDPVPHHSTGMREDYGPAWSPDGKQMAAVIDGHLAVFSVDSEGRPTGPPRQMSTELAESPTWTSDSRHVLYQTDDHLTLVDVVDRTRRTIDPGLTWAYKPPPANKTTIIRAGHLWDGTSAMVRDDMDIVIEGTRIAAVRPHAAAPSGAKVIDASSETVIPGLIEIHSHLEKSYGEALGRIWLSWGITTVRNPAGNPFEDAEEREAVESGVRIGPRTLMAGDPLDGTRIYYAGGTSIENFAQIAEQMRRASRLNYDLIKTYVRLPDYLQKQVVVEAHRLGLPVTSHEYYPAMAYGADGVEHVRGTSRRGYSPKQSQLNRTYGDVVALLAASGMTITPTVGIQGGFQLQTIKDHSWLDDPRMALYPKPVLEPWRRLAGDAHSDEEIARRSAMADPIEKAVFDIVKAGGRVTAGTDAPIDPYGLSLLMELEQYVDGGLTPLQALQSATVVSAKAIGLGNDLGSVAPGHLADLAIIDGNPLANIRDLRRVSAVVKDGVEYTEAELLRRPVP